MEEEETQNTSKVTVRLSKWDWTVVTWEKWKNFLTF